MRDLFYHDRSKNYHADEKDVRWAEMEIIMTRDNNIPEIDFAITWVDGCSVIDNNILKEYDENFAMCDDVDVIASKINHLLHTEEEEEKDSEQETLSQREKEIITCVVKGMTNKAIADKLYLSIHTVITHRRNIARKLQIHSPAGLTIYAIVNKLVELSDIKDSL